MTTPEARPGPATERLDVLDALRGFALLGILLANVLVWSGWIMVDDAGKAAWAGETAALWQHRLHFLLVDGKFYTLFSLLFGLGFALQLGLVGRLPLSAIYAYAVGLYAVQVLFSRWWLARHAQGPTEALWRRWTYGPGRRPATDLPTPG